MEMTFTAEPVDAAKAESWGLVSRVVPPGQLMDAAKDLARRIATNPPQALRWAKRLIREGQHLRLEALLELSAAYQGQLHQTEDHREAVAAMLEKREPVFRGR
jgi:enoyl-CoA hydratase/carnithine racemase